MSVKLEDIAKETGFSISTVSRVLSNSDYPVSEQIREKVFEAKVQEELDKYVNELKTKNYVQIKNFS